METFLPLTIGPGLRLDLPSITVRGWHDSTLEMGNGATHYGMVTEGEAELEDAHGALRLRAGMFFVVPGAAMVTGKNGQGMVISLTDDRGLRQCGGPLEATGRLRYIDGCSDTLLVCPPRLGGPCLNHLHLPPGTRQSAHTHPSERIGVIWRGQGECRTPDGIFSLTPGLGWRIPAGCRHAFWTEDESLDVIAWHPDSDFGPTDDDHPMKNRTFLA